MCAIARVGSQNNRGDQPLAPTRVRHAERTRFEHGAVRTQDLLHLRRVDVLAARDYQVITPVQDVQFAMLTQVSNISRVEPAVSQRLDGRIWIP